jgi:hypothetical protein
MKSNVCWFVRTDSTEVIKIINACNVIVDAAYVQDQAIHLVLLAKLAIRILLITLFMVQLNVLIYVLMGSMQMMPYLNAYCVILIAKLALLINLDARHAF